jgi:hypothetical protein
MAIILQDPVGLRDPSAGHAFPDPGSDATGKASLIPRRTLAEELLTEFRADDAVSDIALELESPAREARVVYADPRLPSP